MTEYHVAIDHIDPDTLELTTTYLGVVDQAHVDEVRAIAGLKDSERWVKEHPRLEGAFMVLRDDGDLDVYVPTDAAEYRVYAPDPEPRNAVAAKDPTGDADPDAIEPGKTVTVFDSVGTGVGALAPDLPRGISGPAYISGVMKFGDQSIGGAMDYPGSPPRSTWHSTESPSGRAYFYSVAAYLIRVGAEPQVIYDPDSDLLGQFGPLTQSGRALRNDGSRRTNREGKVNVQVEVLARANDPWTKGFDAAKKPNYRKLIAAMRAHGIPDVWPAGKPPATAALAAKGSRSRATWQSKGGHYAHAQVPGNDHWDPGAIDTTIVPGKAAAPDPGSDSGSTPSTPTTYTVKKGDTLTAIADKYDTTVSKLVSLNGLKGADDLAVGQKLKLPGKAAPATPQYEPFPGAGFFHGGRHSPIITALGRRLVQLGFGKHYSSGPGPNWTNADRANVRDFQLSRADLKGDADGIPGPKTWAALKIPKV